jgi:hypothetical protein
VADPTGVFEVRANRPDPVTRVAVSQIEPPVFVTVMGEAHFFSGNKDSGPGISLVQMQESDRAIRDLWVLRTAEVTCARLVTLSKMIQSGSGPAGCAAAIRQYAITEENIRQIAEMVCHALRSIAPAAEMEAGRDGIKEKILTIIRESAGVKGIPLSDIVTQAGRSGIGEREVRETIRILIEEDECYQPAKEVFKPL